MQEYIRDYAMYTAIFGLFSMVWFGWAQENPKKSWRKYIGIASGFALILFLIGVYLSITNWDAQTALSEQEGMTNYLLVFYGEMIIGAIGFFVLFKFNKKQFVAPWIALIVGVHFFFLVDVFNDPSLHVLAILLIIVSALTPWIAKRLSTEMSAITGIGAGALLFCFSLLSFIRYLIA